jgi:hypothetical protein
MTEMTTQDAITKMQALMDNAATLDVTRIETAVSELAVLSGSELKSVCRSVLGAALGRNREQHLAQLTRNAVAVRRDALRVAGILAQ